MISKHFSRKELACKCECGQDTVDVRLSGLLEEVRVWAGASVTVTSGNRCVTYNKKIGGSPKSQHILGKAADIVVAGKSAQEVYDKLCEWYPESFGFGNYGLFTHVDVRSIKARF